MSSPMTYLNPVELRVNEERVSVPVRVEPPITRGSLDVWLSDARGGPPINPILTRTVVVRDGVLDAVTLFARDIRDLIPRGGRRWLVVGYGGEVVATGPVKILLE